MRSIPGHLTDAELVLVRPGAALRESSSSTPSSSASAPPLFLLTEGADQLIRVSTGAMPARLSPAVRGHRDDCPEIDWIECPQVALNLHAMSARTQPTYQGERMVTVIWITERL